MSSHTPIAVGNGIQAYAYWDSPVPVSFAGQQSKEPWIFNPTTFTLITTENEAVLVDAPAVKSRADALAAWVAKVIGHRKLSSIYITHGHGDHFFAAGVLQEHFPGAVIRATQGTYTHIQEQASQPVYDSVWVPVYPELAGTNPPKLEVEVLPEDKDSFIVDGHEFRAVKVAGGDIADSTVLHVPDLDLVATGDVVYGNIYQYFGESTTPELRQKWIDAIDQVAQLRPKVVIPSHRQSTDDFSVGNLERTKEYIRAWDKLNASTKTWQELEAAIEKAYPERFGNFVLRLSELVAKGDVKF